MIKPSLITNWLEQPQMLSEADRKDVVALLGAYPFFTPLRYIEAYSQHKDSAYAADMMSRMQLYEGNWLLFNEFLQTSSEDVTVSIPEEVPAANNRSTEEDFFEMEYPAELAEEENENDFAGFNKKEQVSFRDFNEETMIAEEIEFAQENEEIKLPLTNPQHTAVFMEKTVESVKDETESGEHEDTIIESQEPLIQPIYTEDYFLHQGIAVSDEIPEEIDHINQQEDKSLMVVMSFSEWLMHFKTVGEKQKEELQDQKALKTMWQKEKLAAALEEENEEIPETVFEMAVNSITKEEDLVSESLAEILVKQGKQDKAIDMYRKLSLRNPQKSAYFARKIDEIQKEKEL